MTDEEYIYAVRDIKDRLTKDPTALEHDEHLLDIIDSLLEHEYLLSQTSILKLWVQDMVLMYEKFDFAQE
jgi:hypothetical protein